MVRVGGNVEGEGTAVVVVAAGEWQWRRYCRWW